jgi:cytochrome c peroxidase
MTHKGLLAISLGTGILLLVLALTTLLSIAKAATSRSTPVLSPIEQLGKSLYFDQNLSKNGNQSCATCHAPEVGFTGADELVNAHAAVYPGSDAALAGNSNPPTAAYAGDSPKLHYDAILNAWVGGMFWDGRADGSVLGDPLAEQAKGPFLNPLEMGLTTAEDLCGKVKAGTYTAQFEQVWGAGALDCTKAALVYDQIGKSIAAYERSAEVSSYTSKFDQFWDTSKARGLDVTTISAINWANYRSLGLVDAELYGLATFNDPTLGNCASCHSLKAGSQGYPMFTNYSYANLGVPKNPENPFYTEIAYNPAGAAWVDNGLGDHLQKIAPQSAATEIGKVKIPTLRNVDKRPSVDFVKAYMHNGAFKSLPEILRFYMMRGMFTGMNGSGINGMMMGGMRGMRGMGGMGGMATCMNAMGTTSLNSNPFGMQGMGMGMGMLFTPEVNLNLATTNMLPCPEQSYLLSFLSTLSDGYYQRQ